MAIEGMPDLSNITGNVAGKINLSDVFSSIPGISTLLNIAKIAGVVVIIYIVFLIIKVILGIGSALRMRKLAKNVEEINRKMDMLVGKKSKKN